MLYKQRLPFLAQLTNGIQSASSAETCPLKSSATEKIKKQHVTVARFARICTRWRYYIFNAFMQKNVEWVRVSRASEYNIAQSSGENLKFIVWLAGDGRYLPLMNYLFVEYV